MTCVAQCKQVVRTTVTVSNSVIGRSIGDMLDSLFKHRRVLASCSFAEMTAHRMFLVVTCQIMPHHCWMCQQDSTSQCENTVNWKGSDSESIMDCNQITGCLNKCKCVSCKPSATKENA
ncbi:hypothetical protein ILYODFUR_029247 [Ilyodon furcidens]|uniref:Uncharacterized protein n=1 Tax=Ilyodon furcidens TaxID=33524 RepID=A0ABV0TYN7_9TELE